MYLHKTGARFRVGGAPNSARGGGLGYNKQGLFLILRNTPVTFVDQAVLEHRPCLRDKMDPT